MLVYDPIEQTLEYKKAMRKIQPIIDAEYPPDREIYIGQVHQYWNFKKELLLKEGIKWKSPKEMNPNVTFD